DPPIRPGLGTAGRLPVRGRDRPLAVPAVAGVLGAVRGRRQGPAVRVQRQARALRGPQPAKRDPLVPGAGEAAERRLPSVPRADPGALSRMAGVALVGSGRESYGPGFATRGARLGDPAGVAAGPVSRAEPGGSPVAPRERAGLCESAIWVDRGTGSSLPPLPGGIVCGRDA